jgi:hypothetical protein
MSPLPRETLHLPFESGPYRMALGLIGRTPDLLFEIDTNYQSELAERRALFLTEREDVLAALPDTESARMATLARVATTLVRKSPAWFEQDGAMLHNRLTGERWNLAAPDRDPLEVAGLLVQEDLCLIDPDAPDGPTLIAGVLCFPSHWSLRQKLGRPLAAIHAPVPMYGDRLAAPVDRLMRHLKTGRLAERFNWGLTDCAALRQPAGHGRTDTNPVVTAENAGESLYMRVERQTLSVLAESRVVLFTIRVHRYGLSRLAAPDIAGRLAAAVRALPPELLAYKSIAPFREAALAWLDTQAT